MILVDNAAGHVSDSELDTIDDDTQGAAGRRIRDHVGACEACRRRRDEAIRLRELLAQTGQRERRPLRDGVPGAMMRLRLRRHSITNANELLEGFAAFVRGVASLFSLPSGDDRLAGRTRDAKGEHDE